MAYELDRQHDNEYRTSTIYSDKQRKFTTISSHTIQNQSRDKVRLFENHNNQSRPILAKLNCEASEPAKKPDMQQPSKQKPPSTPTTTLADGESKKAGGGLIVLEQMWPPERVIYLTLVVETRRPKPPTVVVENRRPRPLAMCRTSTKPLTLKSPRDKGDGWCGGQQPLIAPPSITATSEKRVESDDKLVWRLDLVR